jgi:cytochrome b involved in lipid metabolism
MLKKYFFSLVFGSLILIGVGAGCANNPPSVTTTLPDNSTTEPTSTIPNTTPTTSPSITPTTTTTSSTPTTTTTPKTTLKEYTLAQVQAANTAQKCWTVVNGQVYDVTAWADKHPGGRDKILGLCGKDGTSVFTKQHGGQEQPEKVLAGYEIGMLKK